MLIFIKFPATTADYLLRLQCDNPYTGTDQTHFGQISKFREKITSTRCTLPYLPLCHRISKIQVTPHDINYRVFCLKNSSFSLNSPYFPSLTATYSPIPPIFLFSSFLLSFKIQIVQQVQDDSLTSEFQIVTNNGSNCCFVTQNFEANTMKSLANNVILIRSSWQQCTSLYNLQFKVFFQVYNNHSTTSLCYKVELSSI